MPTSAPPARTSGLVSTRMVLDHSGNLWRISEMMAEQAPGAPPASCLVLSSQNRYHRVWSYPDDWMRRRIDELLPEPKAKPRAVGGREHPSSRRLPPTQPDKGRPMAAGS